MSKLIKTIPVALGLAGILGGCVGRESTQTKIDELAIAGSGKVEIIKDEATSRFTIGYDERRVFYMINVYDSSGALVFSLKKDRMYGEDIFVQKNKVYFGSDPKFEE